MSCILSIAGENLDIDRFAEECRIPYFEKSYKGDIISVKRQRTKLFSLLKTEVSVAGFDKFNDQVTDVTQFLQEHKDKLNLINIFPGIDWAILSFGINSTIDANSLTQTLYIPADIVGLCGMLNIGLELAMYSPDINEILASKYAG